MSDKQETYFEKYLRNIEKFLDHEDIEISQHAKTIMECAIMSKSLGLGDSEISTIQKLEETKTSDNLSINSINYIHLQLIKALKEDLI